MPLARAEVEPGVLRACYELFKHAHHPRRLESNVLLARILSNRKIAGRPDSEAEQSAHLLDVLHNVLAKLPLGRRMIVQRCDLGGERFATVARDLSMSERNLFRERRAGMIEAARYLSTIEPATAALVEERSLLTSELTFATLLEQNGHWQEGADILQRLLERVPGPDAKSRFAGRIASLYLAAGRLSLADHHATMALRFASEVGNDCRVAEAEVATAWIALASGDARAALQIARCSDRVLRSWISRDCDVRAQEAFVENLALTAELAIGRGDVTAALAASAELQALLEIPGRVEPRVAIAAKASAAHIQVFLNRDVERTERNLWSCYQAAIEQGLAREAIAVATDLAGHYRLHQRAREAADLLLPLLGRARLVATGESRGGFFSELVNACLETGRIAAAEEFLPDLRESARGNPLLQPVADLVSARIHFAQRRFADSLRAAEVAETGYIRVGRGRLAGVALRVQAESLAGLGQSELAARTMDMAIERFKAGSHPLRLAEAYQTMASITGQRRYLAAAQRVRANCAAH